MSSTPKFAHCDTKKPDGFYVQFERLLLDDFDHGEPDWLFQDEEYREQDQARLDAFHAGDWHFVGVRACAKCLIVSNGTGTFINLESPGCWGIESDSGESYFDEVYSQEIGELKSMIEAMQNPVYEE